MGQCGTAPTQGVYGNIPCFWGVAGCNKLACRGRRPPSCHPPLATCKIEGLTSESTCSSGSMLQALLHTLPARTRRDPFLTVLCS